MKNSEDIEYLKSFGQNLKKIRLSKGLTQEDLANDLNWEVSQISRIERGVLNTSILNLKKLSTSLEVNISILFEFSDTDI